MKLTKEQKNKAARYRTYYPEQNAGLDDVDVLLRNHAISYLDARAIRNPLVKKLSTETTRKKTMTQKQYDRLMDQEKKAAQESLIDLNAGREGDPLSIEDVAYDMATNIVFMHPEIQEFLMSVHGMQKSVVVDAVADNLV